MESGGTILISEQEDVLRGCAAPNILAADFDCGSTELVGLPIRSSSVSMKPSSAEEELDALEGDDARGPARALHCRALDLPMNDAGTVWTAELHCLQQAGTQSLAACGRSGSVGASWSAARNDHRGALVAIATAQASARPPQRP